MTITVTPRLATIFDQAVVSIVGFSTMLIFARGFSAVEWATLSFAAGIALVLQGIHINGVTIPMITFNDGNPINDIEQQNWTWLNRLMVIALCAVSVLVGLLVMKFGANWVGESFLYAALLMPPTIFYEYQRRRLILQKKYQTLMHSSIAYAVGVALSVGAVYFLAKSPLFAALSFWPGMLLAIAVSGLRDPPRFTKPANGWFKPLRSFAPAAIGSSLAGTGYNFAVLAVLAAFAGPHAVASFNATRIFMQPINTLVGAMSSLDIPRAASAYALSGRALLTSQIRVMLRLVVIGGSYLILLCFYAEELLFTVFGDRYPQEIMIWGWSAVGFFMLIASPAETAFYVTRKTGRLFLNKLLASIVACALAIWIIPTMGAIGAVLSIAVGWAISFIGGARRIWQARNDGPVCAPEVRPI